MSKRQARRLQVSSLQLLANCKAVLEARGFQPIFLMKNQYTPTEVSPPCETLRDLFVEHNLTPAVFAAYSGMPIEVVIELTEGVTPITLKTAAILSRMFSVPVHFWINRQEDYDKWAKQNEDKN